MNRKGNLAGAIGFILVFGIVATMIIFITLVTNNLMSDTVGMTSSTLQNLSDTMGLNTSVKNAIASQEATFNSISLPIDQIFLVVWISLFLGSTLLSYFTPALPKFNFLTFIVIGLLFMMFALNLVAQIMEFLVKELLTDVFTASELNLPIYNYFIGNYWVIVPIWLVWLLFVNQLSNLKGRTEDDLREEFIEE